MHKIYTIDGWKNVLALQKGDLLPVANQYVFPDKDYIICDDVVLNEDLAFLMGILVSEGCVSGKHNVSMVNTDKKLIDYTAKIFDRLRLKYQI